MLTIEVVDICGGKGKKDRITMLSLVLLNALRTYYKAYKPKNTYLKVGKEAAILLPAAEKYWKSKARTSGRSV